MSVAGFKKQYHKAHQLISEKISGSEGTKLDDDFQEMERKIEVTNKAVMELLSKTTEYLQPNPAYRAKLGVLNTMSKVRGQTKTIGYPQTEGLLGDCMLLYGRELGDVSAFGKALKDVGECMKQLAEVKDSFDIYIKQNFIDPLHSLQDKDLKEITHHLRKLEGRRLDYDYKKKRVGKLPNEEIRQAEMKFAESKDMAEKSMFNFLENDIEQVNQLAVFVEAALHYHKHSMEILEQLHRKLHRQVNTNFHLLTSKLKPKPTITRTTETHKQNGFANTSSPVHSRSCQNHSMPAVVSPAGVYICGCLSLEWCNTVDHSNSSVPDQPCCRAVFDFEPENEGELAFKEGDFIILTNQIDENWFEGMMNGESGFFPINYVKVIVHLPR